MPNPVVFGESWIRAWNARDIEAVLAHYADDIVFTSPTALRVVPESGGVIEGKAALRSYWTVALGRNPDLHFTLVEVYAGIDTVALHYRNQRGALVDEVLTFRDGLIAVGHAMHLHTEPDGTHEAPPASGANASTRSHSNSACSG